MATYKKRNGTALSAVQNAAEAVKKNSASVANAVQSGQTSGMKKVSDNSSVRKNTAKKSSAAGTAKKSNALAGTGKIYDYEAWSAERSKASQMVRDLLEKDNSYDRQFTPEYFENNSRYNELYQKKDGDMTATELGEVIDLARRVQAGESYRTKKGTGSYAAGSEIYEVNDAINNFRSDAQWQTMLSKASEQDISDVIKTWQSYLDDASADADSDYARRTQEDLETLKNYARKNYSAYNEGEMVGYAEQIAKNNRRLKELGAYDARGKADVGAAEYALALMRAGSEPMGIVESDDGLRSAVGYDSLAAQYKDRDALNDAIIDRLNAYVEGGGTEVEYDSEAISKLKGENIELNKQMQAAAKQRDDLARLDYLQGLTGDAAGFNAPEYSAYEEYEKNDEHGNKTNDVRYNAPTLAQIIDDPEAVYKEYQKYQAATGASGYAETIGLARQMTEDEREAYRAIYASYGAEIAEEWFDIFKPTLEQRETQAIATEAQGFAQEHPIIGGALSIATNELAKRQRQADMIRTIFGGEPSERQQEAITEALRSTVLENLGEKTDWATVEIGGHEYNIFDMLAQGALSTGDEKLATGITGEFHLWDMALDAMATAYLESYEKYGDRTAALIAGLTSGVSEYGSEYAGDLMPGVDMGGSVLGALANWGLNAIGEGAEEVASSAGSEVGKELSYLLTGNGGDMQDSYEYLTENGYSSKEALGILAKEFGLNAIDEFAVGAIAGGMMGAGSAVNSSVQERAANTEAGRAVEREGSVAKVLEAGLRSKDRSTRKISQTLVDKLNLTDSSQPAVPTDAQTQAQLQYVREAVSEEQQAEITAKQQANNEKRTEATMRETAKKGLSEEQQAEITAKQQANNEKRTEATMREPSRGLTKKEARQVGNVYRKVLRAMDVQVERDQKKLSKAIKKRLGDFGEAQVQEATDAIAEVVLEGENASEESVRIAEAVAAKDGVIQDIFTGLKEDVRKITQFSRAALTKTAETAGKAAVSASEGDGEQDVELTATRAERGDVRYTTDAGDTISGAFTGFVTAEDGSIAAEVGGQSVAVDRLDVQDAGTDMLISRSAELAQEVDTDRDSLANIMYYSYRDGQDVEQYTRAFEAAYHYGVAGVNRDSALKRPSVKALSAQQFENAYAAGEAARSAVQPEAARSGGEVRFAGDLESRIKELTANQRASINALTRFAKELKAVSIEFYESQADESGSYMNYENGSYDPTTNTIRIDVNAGRNSASDAAEYAMLRTASHELTHYMRSQNEAGYRELMNYVAENLMNEGENAFDALVEAKMESQNLKYAGAVEEVVADGCEMMFRDSTAVERLATQNKSLFKRVRRWVQNFVQSVKRAFEGVSARSVEARLLEKAEGLQKIWDNALIGAVENVRKGGTEESVSSKQAERRYSKRNAADDAAYIDEAERYFGTTTDFREAGYLLTDGKMLNFSGTHEGGTERGVRYVDHRDIWDVRQSDDFSGTEAMVDFMNAGNIRLMDESGGINLQHAPTKAQEAVLKRFVERHNGYVVVDVDNEGGNTVHTFEYNRGTSGTRVINDIRTYYANGTLPMKQSGIGNFLYGDVKFSRRSSFAEQIDALRAGEFPRNDHLYVMDTPEVLLKAGLEELPILMTQKHAKSIMKVSGSEDVNYHGLTKNGIKQLPQAIENASLIIKAPNYNDRVIVFSGMKDSEGNTVIVPIKVNGHGNWQNVEIDANILATAYGKKNIKQMIVNAIMNDEVLYIDKKSSYALGQTVGVQFPKNLLSGATANSIRDSSEFVKQSSRQKNQFSDREILASAFESVAQNENEREFLEKYKTQIESLNEKEAQRKRVQEAIREKMFSEGVRDGNFRIEMNRLQAEAKQLANEIDRMDRKLLNLEHAKPLQDVLAREQQKAKEKAMELLREGQTRNREKRAATEYRRKIRNVANDFDRKLMKPTEKNYIPQSMVQMSIKMRELVDTRSGREGEKAKAKIAEIKQMYEAYKEDPLFSYVHDEVLDSQLKKLERTVGEKNIYQLNAEELRAVYDVMKAIKKQVADAAKLKSMYITMDGKEATVFDVGKEMYHETAEAEPKLNGMVGDYLNWQLTPDKFFARLAGYKKGSVWEKVGKSFAKGTEKMMEVKRAASWHFSQWTNSNQFDRLGSTKEKDMVDIGLRDEQGKAVKITRGMMLEVYMHLSSSDNAYGFMYGGFSVPNMKKYYANKVAESYGTGSVNTVGTAMELADIDAQLRNQKLTEAEEESLMEQKREAEAKGLDRLSEMRNTIEGKLTEWEKGLIDAIHRWNDGNSRDYINEVTMDMYGIKRAGVANYYPIYRDKAFVNADFASISRNVNLENWGALKDRVPSRAPILLGDITYTMAKSIDQTSRYVGYARVQHDFNKLYNIRMPGMRGSVKKAVETKFGAGERGIGVSGAQYIENFIGSITGSRRSESDFTKAIRRNLPRATMSFNYRVGFSQLSAIPKAAQEVGWDCMLEGLKNGGLKAIVNSDARQELAKRNVFFWDRYNGEGGEREFADAKGGTDPISRAWNWLDDKTKGWMLNLNQKMDVAATVSMYPMAEAWVRKYTNAKEGTAEFDALANEKYTDILRNTQAANTLTEKNDLARSSGGINSMLTMYKSEAFANFNILYDAIARTKKYSADLKNGKNGVTQADVKQARGKIASAVTSVVVASSLMNALIKLGVNAIFSNMNGYRDDDDEVNLKSISSTILGEMADDATGMLTFGGELYDMLNAAVTGERYYDPSPAALEELMTIASAAISLAQKDDATAEDYLEAAEKMVMSACTMMGVPAENAKRQAVGAVNTLKDVLAGQPLSFGASADRTNSVNYARLLKATISGDEKKTEAVLEELVKKGAEEKDIQTGYRAKLKAAFKDGEVEREQAEELLVEYGGKDADEAYWLIEEWEDTDGEYSRYDALRESLIAGDSSRAAEAVRELIDHGVKDSSVASEITELYKSGEATTILALQMRPSRLYTPSKPKGDKDDFNAYFDALLSGRDTSGEVKTLRQLGYSTKNIMTALNGAFGGSANRYAYMAQNNPSECSRLEELILDAYEVLGLNREEERKWIHANWVLEEAEAD